MAEIKTSTYRFKMLTQRLYDLFVKYLSSNRVRAPPESELYDLRSTFQYGAKVHRRSLQCKFKSWAKRMVFENGRLRASNSGKIILPIESCEDVVGKLHGDFHLPIDKIIVEVQKIYTWTKRNFGMDVDDIVRAVLASCNRKDCKVQTLRNYAFLKCNTGMPLFQNINEFENEERQYYIPNTRKSVELKSPFSSSNNMFDAMTQCSSDRFNFVSPAATPNIWKNKLRRRKVIESTDKYLGPSPLHNVIPPKSFKKVRNAVQLSKLLKEAKRAPAEYPAVLTDKKTVFLSSFGLVPKKICSSKVVLEFENEMIRQEQLEKHFYSLYSSRLLRDRSKMKRATSVQRSERKKQIYLNMAKKRYNLRGVRLDYSKDLFASKGAWRSQFTENLKRDKSHPIRGESSSSSEEESDFYEVLSEKHHKKESLVQLRVPVEISHFPTKSGTEITRPIQKEKSSNSSESFVRGAFNPQNPSYLQPNFIRNSQDPSRLSSLLEYKVSEQCQLPFIAPMFIPIPSYNSPMHFMNGSYINQFQDAAFRPIANPNRNDSAELKSNAIIGKMPNKVIPVFLNPKYVEAVHQGRKVLEQALPAAPFKEIKRPQPLKQKFPKKEIQQIEKCIKVPRKILPKTDAPDVNAGAPFVVKVAGAVKRASYDKNNKIEASKQKNDNLHRLKLSEATNEKVDLEIIRFLKWVNQMKSGMTATLFQNGVDKYSQQLQRQLDLGIYIVRGIRKVLKQVEKRTNAPVSGDKDLKLKNNLC